MVVKHSMILQTNTVCFLKRLLSIKYMQLLFSSHHITTYVINSLLKHQIWTFIGILYIWLYDYMYIYTYSVYIQGHEIYTLRHTKTFVVQSTWEDQYPLQAYYYSKTINNESYSSYLWPTVCYWSKRKIYWIASTSVYILCMITLTSCA